MNLQQLLTLYAIGTSEGACKGVATRGDKPAKACGGGPAIQQPEQKPAGQLVQLETKPMMHENAPLPKHFYVPNQMFDTSSAKAVKGPALGYYDAIMYMSPHKESGVANVCQFATPECISTCLNTAGMGGMGDASVSKVQQSRINKTVFYKEDPEGFMDAMRKDVKNIVRKAAKAGLTPALRPNGTSDLPKISMQLAKEFPNVQFYDYTKLPKPWLREMPNYHITFSWSGHNWNDSKEALDHGINVAVPFNVPPSSKSREGGELPKTWRGYKVIDGDKSDIRFLDDKGVIVGLRAKGKARALKKNYVGAWPFVQEFDGGLPKREGLQGSGEIMLIEANRKLHKRIKYQGLDISVENRAGSVRTGNDPHWGPWRTKMLYDYGYVKGSKGMDGGGVDCFVGPNPAARMAYVIHIRKLPDFKKYDEDKVMLGFNSAKAAKQAFMKHYNKPDFYGGMDVLPMKEFKSKVLATGEKGPSKIHADAGEPQVYPGGYAHIEPRQIFRPPSLKHTKPVPVDDPMEKDDKYGDVSRRRSAETIGFRDRLTKKKGSDEKYIGIRTTGISGFPAVGVGGFG
jgi:hypothetical protein